jgi:hypothetical protein
VNIKVRTDFRITWVSSRCGIRSLAAPFMSPDRVSPYPTHRYPGVYSGCHARHKSSIG